MRLILTILIFALSVSIAMAKTDPKVTEFALDNCKIGDPGIRNEDDQIDCVTDIVNCVIVAGGETDLTKLNPVCLNKASQRRIYEQRRK